MLLILIVILLVLMLGGFWGSNQYGPAAFGPVGLIVLILLVLFLTGNLSL